VIKIHEDKELNESELIRTIPVDDMHITSIIYEPVQSHLITGSSIGVISLWEVSTGKSKGAFKDENCEEIAGITY
jgi:WD40 repeat protein